MQTLRSTANLILQNHCHGRPNCSGPWIRVAATHLNTFRDDDSAVPRGPKDPFVGFFVSMLNFRATIPPSPTVAMNALALQKKAQGERVFNLSAGEPMIAPHPAIVQAAEAALRAGKTLYTPAAGIPELRAAVSGWLQQNYQANYSADEILITAGGKFGLYALCRTLLTAGDEAIVIAPYWVSYSSLTEMTGARVYTINTQEQSGWKVTPAQLSTAITQNTRIIFFNNAGNPTGALYTRDELHALVAVAHERGVLFVSDEVYSGLTYDREFTSAGSFPEFRDNVVLIQSCSKHFAMTGWRVGVVVADKNLIKVLADWQSQSTTGTATISQWAAVAAFTNSEVNQNVRAEMQIRRNTLVQALNQNFSLQLTPPAAGLYVFLPMAALGVTETDSFAFCTRILNEASVAMIPGAPFGAEGYVRLSFVAEPSELQAAVQVLAKYLKK